MIDNHCKILAIGFSILAATETIARENSFPWDALWICGGVALASAATVWSVHHFDETDYEDYENFA
ncbi:MAG: hypothetical protein H6909_02410 [Rickettsiaceae bacterium]|nr:hypothetical protein [Rickettsiaceae bacterium]